MPQRPPALDKDLDRHLETVVGVSPWLKGVPGLMLLVFGLGAVAAYFINPPALREPGRENIRYIVLGVGAFSVLAGGFAFWFFALAGKRPMFDAFENGFNCIQHSRAYAVRFPEVADFSVHHAVDENSLAFLVFVVKVDLDNGTVLRFNKDDFGVPGVYKILDHLLRGVGRLRAQPLLTRLAQGETLDLEPFTVNRGGFAWGKESIGWKELKELTTWENRIDVQLKNGDKIPTKINYLDCPNYCILLALAEHYGLTSCPKQMR